MRILISGASGFVGTALRARLEEEGHDVVRLVRRAASGDGEVRWDPANGEIDVAACEGFDAVIHLAGENIAGGRWTEARKRRIVDSRVQGTTLLARTLAELDRRPAVFLSASAVGFFGARGDETLDEGSAMGEGFLAETCRDWEAATREAVHADDIRVAQIRIGLVLGEEGGALPRMLLPFRLGLGGRLGHGRQFMSWIAIDDLTRAIVHALTRDDLRGPVHLVSPNPVTNAEFTRVLARVLRRPALIPVPAFGLRLLVSREFADEALLSGQRAVPGRLMESGFEFEHPDLEGALRHVLGR